MSQPIIRLDHVSATAFSGAPRMMSRIIGGFKHEDLDQRIPHQNPIDIANLTLEVEPQNRLFFAGSARRQIALRRLLERDVKPFSGSVEIAGQVISSTSTLNFLRKNKKRTVQHVAISFLDEIGCYPFGSARDIDDILASGGLLGYANARLGEIPGDAEKALCVILMTNSLAECVVFSEQDFVFSADFGFNLGELLRIHFQTRCIVVTGVAKSPSWLDPLQTILLV